MVEVLPLILVAVALVAMLVLLHGLIRRGQLTRVIERSWLMVPRDEETGLLDRSTCLQRVAAEVKRARRGGGNVWVAVITITSGDPARFGRLLHDSLRMPEVAFRLDDRVVCLARPNLDDASRADVLARVVAAAPREQLAIGEAVWSSVAPEGDAADLLQRASRATGPVVTP